MHRLLPPALWLLCAVGMSLLHWFWPLWQWLNFPVRWLGLAVMVAGLALAVWHKRLFAQVGTNINTFQDPDRLVTTGLFRYSRNPMYLGFVLALMGLWWLLGSASPGLIVLFFFLVTDRWYIRFEEARMAARFGEEYRRYCDGVRRWL